MRITIHNYEVYFIDYLDGKLAPELMNELMLFLELHPDLKEEISSLKEATLFPEATAFPSKEKIKQQNPNYNSFSESCIACLEDDMPFEEKKQFLASIKKNPVMEAEYNLYSKTRLSPDTAIVFHEKNALKKSVLSRNTVQLLYRSISAAAAVLIILFIYFYSGRINTDSKTANVKTTQPDQKLSSGTFKNTSPVIVPENTQNNITVVKNNFQKQKQFINEALDTIPAPEKNNFMANSTNDSMKTNHSLIAFSDTSNKQPDTNYAGNNTLPNTISKEKAYIDIFNRYNYISDMVAKADQPAELISRKDEKKFSLWKLADIGVKGFNLLMGKNVKFETTTNENGDVTALALNSPRFAVSTNIK